MAKKSNWRLWLFIAGALISAALSALAIWTLATNGADFGGALSVAIVCACALPAALFGLPYIDSRINVSYSKRGGLKIEEETPKRRLCRRDPKTGRTVEITDKEGAK
jgi:hypothetical protein